jgi:hypothetical protein
MPSRSRSRPPATALETGAALSSGSDRQQPQPAGLIALASDAAEDRDWDDFLQSTPLGQFQQSSRWARYKACEGWQVWRCVLKTEDRLVGGFQLLWRHQRLGRMGYITKGPALLEESQELAERAVRLIAGAAEKLRLAALIVQPPDGSSQTSPALWRHHFALNRLYRTNDATLVNDLTPGIETVTRRMNKTARREVRQARCRGVIIREGGEQEIGTFFKLMLSSCQRRGEKPNPSNEAALRKLFQLFRPLGARLTIAHRCEEDLAALLSISFRERFTAWKVGWNFHQDDCHSNRLLNYEGLEWACARGYKQWDYAALDPRIATALLNGQPLTAGQTRTRDMFNLSFGGEPRLLPASRIWFRNPLLRCAYGIFLDRSRPGQLI